MADIKNTKNALVKAAQFMNEVEKAAQDDKFSLAEAIGIVPEATGMIMALVKIRKIKEELKDLSSDEKSELITAFAQELDLSNDKAERLIERIVNVLASVMEQTPEFASINN